MKTLPMYQVGVDHYLRAAVVGLLASLVSTWFVLTFGRFFALWLSLLVGFVVGEAIVWATNRKRGVGLQIVAVGCIVLGVLANRIMAILPFVLASGWRGDLIVRAITGDWSVLLFIGLASFVALGRLR